MYHFFHSGLAHSLVSCYTCEQYISGLANLFEGCMFELSTKFRETLLCVHGNFEEQNVLEPSIIIINFVLLLLMHIIII